MAEKALRCIAFAYKDLVPGLNGADHKEIGSG
jgi:hypothetical protein